jgi:hypothetical protein
MGSTTKAPQEKPTLLTGCFYADLSIEAMPIADGPAYGMPRGPKVSEHLRQDGNRAYVLNKIENDVRVLSAAATSLVGGSQRGLEPLWKVYI